MLDTTNELIPNQKGMTSLQIAEVTGKRHDAILRDIRNLLKQGVAAHNFVETSYTDKSNRQSPCFNLTPKGCLILASGYDAVLRERIINRLEYLENEKKVIKTPQTYLEALEALVASEKEKEQLRIETEQQQKYIDAGYFEMTLLPPIRRDNHPDILCQKVFCKPKGLAYINHLFGGKPSDRKISPIK